MITQVRRNICSQIFMLVRGMVKFLGVGILNVKPSLNCKLSVVNLDTQIRRDLNAHPVASIYIIERVCCMKRNRMGQNVEFQNYSPRNWTM